MTRELDDQSAKKLSAASEHYTAYVGPPREYDFMGATQFRLLCSLGLRDHHRVLDFGCGSLRAGRLLIPYLQPGKYFGIEPNTWLVQDAIERQLGRDLIRIKQPQFSASADFTADVFDIAFDFILAQSIFSHAGPALTAKALASFARRLAPDGLCAVTFIHGDEDTPEGWFYAGVTRQGTVRYRTALILELVRSAGFDGVPIPWFHPRQTWWLLGKNLPCEAEIQTLTGMVLRAPDLMRGPYRGERASAATRGR